MRKSPLRRDDRVKQNMRDVSEAEMIQIKTESRQVREIGNPSHLEVKYERLVDA
jgi:hypothetical protein